MIEINDVNKKYQQTTVLNEINERIPSGGITSIIGPNGAGKSTLLSIMSRLLAADSGNVLFNGLDVAKPLGISWRQSFPFYGKRTILPAA